MPVISENSIPIPSLKLYVSLSVLALSASIYYAVNKSNFADWEYNLLGAEVATIDENILKTNADEEEINTDNVITDNSADNDTSERAFQNTIKSTRGPWFTLLSHATNYTLDRLHIERSIMEHPIVAKTTDVINVMFQGNAIYLLSVNFPRHIQLQS